MWPVTVTTTTPCVHGDVGPPRGAVVFIVVALPGIARNIWTGTVVLF